MFVVCKVAVHKLAVECSWKKENSLKNYCLSTILLSCCFVMISCIVDVVCEFMLDFCFVLFGGFVLFWQPWLQH